jgi:hypothetical protein
MFARTGHILNLEEPALFNETLARFCAGGSGALAQATTLLWICRSNLRLSERVCAVHYSVGVQSIDLGVR